MEIDIDIKQSKVNVIVDKDIMYDVMRYDNIHYWFIKILKEIVTIVHTISNCDKTPKTDTLQG